MDTHVHVVSPDEDAFPLDPRPGITQAWYRDEPCSVERLLELMEHAGIDRAVLVQGVSAYGYDNRYTLDSARRHPDRCTSVVCVDVTDADCTGTAEALVRRHGARGIRWFLDPRPFAEARALWTAVAGLGVPLVATILPDRLDELAAAAADLPELPVALDHCGFPDFSRGTPDALTTLAAFPQVHLKVSTMTLDSMAEHGDARDGLAELAARFGGARLMWGSDWSQTHDRPYAELAEAGRAAASKLGDDDRAEYLGRTARRLWPELAP